MATKNDITDYTSTMKNYFIDSYNRDVNILNTYFRVSTRVLPRASLLVMELRELKALALETSKAVRSAAYQKLKDLRLQVYGPYVPPGTK